MPARLVDKPRVLAVALDAADADLALTWAEQGELPTLRRLMQEGAVARLESVAETYEAAVWPTIQTGCLPATHGQYNWRLPIPGTHFMSFPRGRTHRRPFWTLLDGSRTLLLDVPDAASVKQENVTELLGWGERSPMRHESWPPELYADVVDRYGRYPRWLDQDMAKRSVRGERRYLRAMRRALDARTRLFSEMVGERPWDLCLAVYSEPHNGGHLFHRYVARGTWAYDPARADRLGNSLLEIYRSVDESLGAVLASVEGSCDVVVFSGMGFKVNPSGMSVLPQVLVALGYQVPRRAGLRSRLLGGVRERIPWSIRRRVNARMSPESRARLMEQIWASSTDWSRTRAVAEPELGVGWVRISVNGRDPDGTVEPGADYDALCEEIRDELLQLTNAETGAPAVAEVTRVDSFAHGPHTDQFPDLFVRFSEDGLLSAVRHPRVGVFKEDLDHFHTSNHSDDAFLVAAGPHIHAGGGIDHGHISDIAPTLMHLMGAPIPDDMEGSVLTGLLEPSFLEGAPIQRAPVEWGEDPWEEWREARRAGGPAT